MKMSQFTERQIAFALRQAEAGTSIVDVCRKMNENWLMSLDDAPEKVEAWRRHYNEDRSHSTLGNLSPREFAAPKAQYCPAG